MTRIGLSFDELASSWGAGEAPRYAAHVPGLNVLAGETLALTGSGTSALLDRLADELDDCTHIDGGTAAAGGTLRVHAQQAARVGVRALAVTDPFSAQTTAATQLAVADLAGLNRLGVTTVVEVADPELATLVADRVVLVADGEPVVAYPVLAPAPRTVGDVQTVTARVEARLRASA